MQQLIMASCMKRRILLAFLGVVIAAPAPSFAQTEERITDYERRIAQQQEQLNQMRRELDDLKARVSRQAENQAQIAAESGSEGKSSEPFVKRKSENLSLQFSGRLHRMVMSVDDGAGTTSLFTDSEQGPTMLRFDASGKVSDALSVGATIETGIRQNRPFQVSQDNISAGTSVNVRIAEAYLNGSTIGKFSLGRGFGASWLAPEMDLSGTQFASLLPVGMLAPGLKFVDASDNSLSDVQVFEHFVDVERLLLVDRVRYDSPRLGPGLQVSGSLASDNRWDIALRAKPKNTGKFTLVGGASFQDKPFSGIDRRQDAIVSVRHNKTGLNLTIGGVNESLTGGRDANTFLIKGGWLTDLVSLGKTAFSLDYYEVKNLRFSGDRAESVGLVAVQKWPAYGIDIYAAFRRYDVQRPDIDLKDLNLIALGVALNF